MPTRTKSQAPGVAKDSAPESGKESAKPNGGSPLLSEESLKSLYSYMLKCRMVEERARLLFRQGRFAGNYYSAVGQEATEVGATIELLPEDTIAPSHRDFVANIMKGTPLKFMFAQLYARKTSPDQGRSSPAHCGYAPLNVITPASTVDAQLGIGTGVALAYKLRKQPNVVVALSGDDSTNLGFWHESLNFAGIHKLPIVYVVENNHWDESLPPKLQPTNADLRAKAESYGLPGITVDGNDAVAVYRVAHEAIDHARSGGGPTLIECKTHRWYGHSEIGPGKHRTPDELNYWKSKDPIPHMEHYLRKRGLWSDQWKESLVNSFTREIADAVEFAENSPYPEPEEALDHVYSFDIRDRELNRRSWICPDQAQTSE